MRCAASNRPIGQLQRLNAFKLAQVVRHKRRPFTAGTIGNKLPRYPSVPAVRMGRLAVDQNFKGQGLGGALLSDALDRAANSEITAYALVVDAKDESAASFYRHHGFIALPDSQLTLFLPLKTVHRTLHG